jgi:hypothetical protein
MSLWPPPASILKYDPRSWRDRVSAIGSNRLDPQVARRWELVLHLKVTGADRTGEYAQALVTYAAAGHTYRIGDQVALHVKVTC